MEAKTGMFYTPTAHDDVIYTIKINNMTTLEHAMIISLQGIVAQKKAAIYIIEDSDDQKWIDEAINVYGLSLVNMDDPWDLVLTFAEFLNENKYVLYTHCTEPGVTIFNQSINYATTIAGVERYLMISKSLESKAISLGLQKGIDVTESKWNTEYVFNTYKDKLNNQYLVHQNPSKNQLRDYSIAGKALCYYGDFNDGSNSEIGTEIRNWAVDNAPILGWTENEVNFVAANSLLSKVTVAADWAANLSFYSSLEQDDSYSQKATNSVKAESGKHYLCILMSDGDNVQWMTNNFVSSSLYYGSKYRGNFKMNWTTSPSLYDLAPNILNELYQTQTEQDYFVAGPSGVGYINASEYNSKSLEEYAAYTAGYMEKADLNVVNFIDSFFTKDAYKEFAKQPQIKGGICSIGNYYLEGAGGVIWENDKPFVGIRETLWRVDGDANHNANYGYVERVAQRINEYERDYTKIEGYTALVCHAWSIGTMEYIQRFVDMLDEDIVLVNAEEFIDLITKNVKHNDVEELDDYTLSDFANKLCPISTEQYRVQELIDTKIISEKSFLFSTQSTANLWNYRCGGLQYDYAGWDNDKIKLDGSDLDDRIDTFPNSWMYAKFHLETNDKYLEVKVNCGDNADTNYRVRALYVENNQIVSKVLIADNYEKNLSVDGWYLLNDASPSTFIYDVQEFIGKDVIISIEQDDSGEGSGEIVNVNKVKFMETKEFISSKEKWNADELLDEWTGNGKVVKHTEGLCLENYGTTSTISCKVKVPTDVTTFVISVRKFKRTGSVQDSDPKIVIKVNGEIIRAYYAESDYITVNAGTDPRTWRYDISAFAGQTIEIEIANIYGEHACFDKAFFE